MVSSYSGQLAEVASELATEGYETAVVCGGDGTVNEVINGIAGSDTALGVVPLGTGNDFAANMGISENIDQACNIIKQRQVKTIDLVKVDKDKFFAGTGCLGFDAEIAAFASRMRKEKSNSFLLHVLGGIFKLVSYKSKTVELRFDGQKYFGDILLVAFGNIRTYAKGMMITPDAVSDDSLLDICIVRPMARWKIPFTLPSVYKGTHTEKKEVSVYQAGAVFVQSTSYMELYADGDFIATTPFRLQVMPKYLNVIVGSSPA